MNLKKGDILIILFCLVALVLGLSYSKFYSQNSEKKLVIELKGHVYKIIDLENLEREENIKITISPQEYVTLHVDKKGAKIIQSTCPNQICVQTGEITKRGQSIICLPYKLFVYFEDKGIEQEIDAVSY